MQSLKHNIVISCYNSMDEYYEFNLRGLISYENYLVCDNNIDIDKNNMTDDEIRTAIREKYIQDATILILLCGPSTAKSEVIDWILNSAMVNTERYPALGILVVNLPGINMQNEIVHGDDEKQVLDTKYSDWISVTNDKKDLNNKFPQMPSRIIDNFVNYIPITVINWDRIKNNSTCLNKLIDIICDREVIKCDGNTAYLHVKKEKS